MVFWDVDTQADFINPQGKLYVPGAEQIVTNLERLTDFAGRHGISVIASVDAHRPDDPEFKLYPPHCIAGTPGQQKLPGTLLPRRFTVPNHPIQLPDLSGFQQVIVEKETLDVFTNPNISQVLERYRDAADIIVLYGVVTEICVSIEALGLLDRGFRVRLVRDAVRHFETEAAQKTFQEIERRGGSLTTTDEVVGAAA